jgi:hypothetical protein
MIPFWFWFLTATVALGAIAVSSYVVIFMKLSELDKAELAKLTSPRKDHGRQRR